MFIQSEKRNHVIGIWDVIHPPVQTKKLLTWTRFVSGARSKRRADFDRSRSTGSLLIVFALAIVLLMFAPWASAASRPEKPELKIGFIKLTDCAPLVVAYENGYFEDEGLYVTLEAQANWKVLLDRVIDGSLDAAHMLPGQALGAAVGIGGKAKLIAVAGMGLNTLAISMGNSVWNQMKTNIPMHAGKPAHPINARTLEPVVRATQAIGTRFNLGMVFPTSTHNYALRYWLAAGGIHPGLYTPADANGTTGGLVQLSVTPPPQMPVTLDAGTILGYSVGEPWNQHAVIKGLGVPVITAGEIWSRMPEKVLGTRREFAELHPHTVRAIVRAVIRAEQWLDVDKGANRPALARMLSRSEYVGADYNVLVGPLTGNYQYEKDDIRPVPTLNVYYSSFAGYPFYGDAIWYLTQMRRWGQIATEQTDAWYDDIAKKVYRPDIYRDAANDLIASAHMKTTDLPPADSYAAPPSQFIDGIVFDPAKPNAYLGMFAIGTAGQK